MHSRQKILVTEYAKPAAIHEDIAKRCAILPEEALDLLVRIGNRISEVLALETSPVFIGGDGIQFRDISGVLSLAPGVEFEIAPKFLGNTGMWKEDFFFLAMLTHYGKLLDGEELQSSSREDSSLSTLIGRSLVEMYWKNHRRPLRTYRQLHQCEFALEGDFDPENLSYPMEEGFPQFITTLTRMNIYNATIRDAAAKLIPIVPDIETRMRLERLVYHLPYQTSSHRTYNHRLPSRFRNWQSTFDLSLDILRGLSGTYESSTALAPGYVLRTWQIWENLVFIALREYFSSEHVDVHSLHLLGERKYGKTVKEINVIPDAIVTLNNGNSPTKIIVDAKYKSQVRHSTMTVSTADIYEALAFSRASQISEVMLIYPRPFSEETSFMNEVGIAREFSSISIGEIRIHAIEIGVCGISGRNGTEKFSDGLSEIILKSVSS